MSTSDPPTPEGDIVQITLLFPPNPDPPVDDPPVVVVIGCGEEIPQFVTTTIKGVTPKQIKTWLEDYKSKLPTLRNERLRRLANPNALPPPVSPVIPTTEPTPSNPGTTQTKLF